MKKVIERVSSRLKDEGGAALILAITVLIVLTVIGVAALNTSSLQVKMIHNVRLYNTAFYRADGSLNVAVPVVEEILYLRGFSAAPFNFEGSANVVVNDIDFHDEAVVVDSDGVYKGFDAVDFPEGTEDSGDDGDGDRSNDLGNATATNPDIVVSGVVQGAVDVDGLGTTADKGFSILMAMGYEGLGKGVAGGGASRWYEVNARGAGPLNTVSRIKGKYRHKI